MNITKLNNLIYLYLFIPVFLVTGPAIPDITLSLIAIFGLFLFYKNWQIIKETKILFLFSSFFFIFYTYLILGSFFSLDFKYAFLNSIPFIRYYFFTIAVVFLLNSNFNFFMNLLFNILTVLLLILSIDGIYEYFFHYNIFHTSNNAYIENRISGLFRDEWIIGSFFVRILPIYIYLFFQVSNNKNIYIFSATVFLSFLIIFLSGERAPLLLSFIIIFFLLINLKINRNYLFLFIILFFVINIIDDSSIKRILLLANISEKYYMMYHTAILMFIDNPFFGIGANSFRNLCEIYSYALYGMNGCSSHPHNIYIQLLAETGFIPFLIILMAFLVSFFYVFKFVRYNINKSLQFLLILILINFFPLLPSLNFFNNWFGAIIFFSIPILIHEICIKSGSLGRTRTATGINPTGF